MSVIVIVDDDELNLDILSKMLRHFDHEILGFSMPQEAYEYVSTHAKDVVLLVLDKMMPGMTGIELFEALQKLDDCKKIPVIIQSADAYDGSIRMSLDNGIFAYITKPFEQQEIRDQVAKALGE